MTSPPNLLRLTVSVILALGGSWALGGCAGSAPPVTAGVEASASIAEEVDRARAALTPIAEQAVGFSVAVAQAGRVVWSEAYGYQDLRQRRPATPATRFRLYSLSKPITAAAAARLMERRQLDPRASIRQYVPTFPDKGAAITPMHLATHASGIRHYTDAAEARSSQHCDRVADALDLFATDPLVHAPGAGETYSSWGYVLLSAVVEGASGASYEDAVGDLVFEPAGLMAFAIDDPSSTLPERSRFYSEDGAGVLGLSQDVDNTCKWGAGAWLGTAEEVARFGLALVDDEFLSPRTQQLFLRGEPAYRVQGIGAGGTAFLIVDDARDLSIALLSNTDGETAGLALQEIFSTLYAIFADAP